MKFELLCLITLLIFLSLHVIEIFLGWLGMKEATNTLDDKITKPLEDFVVGFRP